MTGNQSKYANEERRLAIKQVGSKLNGINYLEVYPSNILDSDTSKDNDNIRIDTEPSTYPNIILVVYCFKEISDLQSLRVLIKGGLRIKDIKIKWIKRADEFINSSSYEKDGTINRKNIKDRVDGNDLIRIIESTQKYYEKTKRLDNVLIVCTDKEGDFSKYTLCLVNKDDETKLPPNFDLVFSKIDFFFKFDSIDPCPLDLSPTEYLEEPTIDYMAKDFASFNRLMLDRLSSIIPDWQERSPADLGIALVDLFAYIGDHLSYFQDAVGTEAYLSTARKRISLKRHARLLDYSIREGSNSRVWVCFELDKKIGNDLVIIPDRTRLLTNSFGSDNDGMSEKIVIYDENEVIQAFNNGAGCFQTVGDTTNLCYERNEIHFHTWHNSKYCLPTGSTRASLRGDNKILKIKKGDILIFEEIDVSVSSQSKSNSDENNSEESNLQANPLHRHAVRIEDVQQYKGGDGLFDPPMDVLEIVWSVGDALPFPLLISEVNVNINNNNKNNASTNFVVRGNVVLAEHGYTVYEFLGATANEGKFYPRLSLGPLSHRPEPIAKYTSSYSHLSATGTIVLPDANTSPNIRIYQIAVEHRLTSSGDIDFSSSGDIDNRKEHTILSHRDFQTALTMDKGILYIEEWNAKKDLLNCNEFDKSFVAEIDTDGTVSVRFGDDKYGQSPPNSTDRITHLFYAAYQAGNGVDGNVGAETVSRIAATTEDNNQSKSIVTPGLAPSLNSQQTKIPRLDTRYIIKIRNPLEAGGGSEPQDSKSIRAMASKSLQTSHRAVTEQDYIRILKTHPKIQKATARIIWTGSWYTVFITVERSDGQQDVDDEFKKEIENFLNTYRLAGYDLEIDGPKYVPLYILIEVRLAHNFFENEIKQELCVKFGNTSPISYQLQQLQQIRGSSPSGDLGWSVRRGTGLFDSSNLDFGQPVKRSELNAIALSIPGVGSVDILQFRRMINPTSDEIENKNNTIDMDANEIPKVDNNPDNPEYGRIEFILEGGL